MPSGGSSSSPHQETEAEAEVATAMMDLHDRLPENEQEAEQVEQVLAEALNKLSLEERENIELDIHGVKETQIDEEEAEEKLEELEEELVLLEEKEAYERALQLNRAYVEDREFRLLFLRTVGFDAKKAAKRLVLHFEVKRELFVRDTGNDDILVRNITWEDLDEHDKLVVMSGLFQVGPERDVAGRTIFFCVIAVIQPSMNFESMSRALWYVRMAATQTDREMRRKGVVAVVINFRKKASPRSMLQQLIHVSSGIPSENAAVHYVYNNPALQPAIMGVKLMLYASAFFAESAFRIRFYFGDMKKVSFELQTYGVPTDSIPVKASLQDGGTGVSLEWHLQWLQTIRHLELNRNETNQCTVMQNESISIIPGKFDVLFGKSKKARQHSGTVRCHNLVRRLWGAYEDASRRDKTKVADEVIGIIADSGGLFLRWEKGPHSGGYWIAVEHEVARSKVSHIFRHLREMEQIKDFQPKSTSASGGDGYGYEEDASTATDKSMRTCESNDSKKKPISQSPGIERPRAKQRKTNT